MVTLLVIMWTSILLKQLKFNLEIYKIVTESQLRIINRELENIKWDLNLKT